jgi:hypothetical protein
VTQPPPHKGGGFRRPTWYNMAMTSEDREVRARVRTTTGRCLMETRQRLLKQAGLTCDDVRAWSSGECDDFTAGQLSAIESAMTVEWLLEGGGA